MKNRKYKKVTAHTLEHILLWGDHMCKSESWTKSDTNTYCLLKQEIKRLRNEEYLRRKAIEANPYIDPTNPINTT